MWYARSSPEMCIERDIIKIRVLCEALILIEEIALRIDIKTTRRVWNQLFLQENGRYDVYLQPHMPQVSCTSVFRKILDKITCQMKKHKGKILKLN